MADLPSTARKTIPIALFLSLVVLASCSPADRHTQDSTSQSTGTLRLLLTDKPIEGNVEAVEVTIPRIDVVFDDETLPIQAIVPPRRPGAKTSLLRAPSGFEVASTSAETVALVIALPPRSASSPKSSTASTTTRLISIVTRRRDMHELLRIKCREAGRQVSRRVLYLGA